MYIQTSIAKLSRNQLKNLLEGKRVRIKKSKTIYITASIIYHQKHIIK